MIPSEHDMPTDLVNSQKLRRLEEDLLKVSQAKSQHE